MEIKYIALIFTAAIVVLVAASLFIDAKSGYEKNVFNLLYKLVVRAEEVFDGTKRGQEKKAWVIERIHAMLPGWAKILITEKEIDALIEAAVDKMKEALKNAAKEA